LPFVDIEIRQANFYPPRPWVSGVIRTDRKRIRVKIVSYFFFDGRPEKGEEEVWIFRFFGPKEHNFFFNAKRSGEASRIWIVAYWNPHIPILHRFILVPIARAEIARS